MNPPEDHAASMAESARFFDEHVAPGKCPVWIANNRDECIRDHATWFAFELRRKDSSQQPDERRAA